MKSIQVFDKPMCCSTGICGPDVDPELPRFAGDLEWLKSQGYSVQRFNLAQQPQAFIDNQLIHQLISTEGTDCLPVILVDGETVSRKIYPTREQFSQWLNKSTVEAKSLPVAGTDGGCCGSNGCC
jgi:hypothetical protein